ncbi:hypothetical protein GKE82_24925 [Conexibacter sp. W3-3-2]|uniref:thrombospondin type 3 repeat-containing protein n=1 Tax=Conexibacter sp. W3-3-2 TaxID=2675227 RepID=UPI0012B7FB5C|nr:thrombospondin type 3 repeat-containing protein [Conexibacter sp. W3-3-2]MTD47450.1 hypothetical protein [Conexibacter sp. W3-3-2]
MRAGRPHPNGFGDSSGFVLKNGSTVLEDCVQLYACGSRSGPANYGLGGASSVTFGVQCTGANGCPADTVSASMRGMRLQINDGLAPAISGFSGSLTSTATTIRTRQLAFSATDQGGGVFRRRLVIDDVPQALATVDGNGGACATPFTQKVPCKLSASETFSFDTATLTDGTHDISLRVTDATDTNQAQTAAWTIKVDNVAPSFGTPTVSGSSAQVGTELTCSPGAIDGQSPTVSYQWLRANADGSGQQEIPGATSAKYTPAAADQSKKLLCRVTATDGGGSTTKTSTTTSGPFDNGATVQPAPTEPAPSGTACPSAPTGTGNGPTEDADGDRIPNCADSDDDGDGVPDAADPAPFDPKVPGEAGKDPASSSSSPSAGGVAASSGTGGEGAGLKVNGENGHPQAVLSAVWLKGRTRGQTTRYGTSATIRGQLARPDGGKVDDAKIELVYLEAGTVRDMGGARTRKDGSFVIKLPSNSPSRKLQLRYRYDLSKQDVTSKVELALTVRATARLSVAKRPGAIRLRGKIGAPGKLGGRKVTIQYRTAGRAWRPFLTLRSTSRGAFSGRYRLAAPLSGTVQFRAVIGSATSHIGGASPTRKVRF